MTRKRLLLASGTVDTELLANNSVTLPKIESSVATTIVEGGGPKITAVGIANSAYTILDDTAVSTSGGYIVVSGTGFKTGAQVLIDATPATSVTFVSSTTLRAQVPAKSAATYNIYVVNTDGGTAIGVNGLTYSALPSWVTSSTLQQQTNAIPFNLTLSATSATNYAVANGSSLPSGTNLLSNGYFYGTVTGLVGATTYNFDIKATDAENQDSERSFSITFNIDSLWIREISSGSYDNYAAQLGVDSNNNVYVVSDSRAVGPGAPSSNNTVITKYTNLGVREFSFYDTTNSPSEEEVTAGGIDIYDNVLYYATTSAVDSGSTSQYRTHKVWAVHTSNAATFWSAVGSFYHPSYDYLDSEGGSFVVDENHLTHFFGINSRMLHGGYTNRPRSIMATRFHRANSAFADTYQYYYTNSFCNSTTASDNQIVFDTVTNRTDETFICGQGAASGPLRGFVTRLRTNHAKDANPAFYSASNWSFSRSEFRFRKITMDSTYVYAIAEGVGGDGNCYLFKFARSNGTIAWQKYLWASSSTLRAGGICVDGEGAEDVYVQMHKSDFSKTYIVKINNTGAITWQKAFRHGSGTAVIAKGLDNANNNLFGLYTINGSPKKVLLFKFLKDGTGTSTYSDYVYETTTDIGITNTSYANEESVHTNFAPSGGSVYSPSGVLNNNTYRFNAAPFLTYTEVTG